MKVYSKEGQVFRLIAYPDETVFKGDYLVIEDAESKVSVLVQVMDVGYIETPGLLEELVREGLLEGKRRDIDPYDFSDTTKFLRDTKLLLCVARGVVRDGIYVQAVYDLPSRSGSTIRRIPSSAALTLATDQLGPEIWVGHDRDGFKIRLDAGTLDGSLTFITGMKGSGKSHLAKLLLLGLVEKGAPAIVFDLNGEYVGLDKRIDGRSLDIEKRIKIYQPGKNLFFTLDYLGVETISRVLVNVLRLPGVSASIFHEIWPLSEKAGHVTLEKLQKIVGRSVSNMMVKDALISRFLTLRGCGFITDVNENLVRLEDMVTGRGSASIIILRELPSIARKILVEIILNKLVALLERGRMPPLFLFAEEAHLYVRQTYWEDIATRMRHFGLFVTFISNQPDALDLQIFRQLDNIFLFRFKNDHDLEAVSRISDIDAQTVKVIAKEVPRGMCLAIGNVVSGLPLVIGVRKLDVAVMGQTRKVFGNRHKVEKLSISQSTLV